MTLLNIPIAVWLLQVLYVLLGLSILAVLFVKKGSMHKLQLYLLAMVIVNIAWRLAIRQLYQ